MISTTFLRWGWLLLSACLVGLLGYTLAREQFSALIGLYLLLFWGYNLRIRPILLAMPQPGEAILPDRFLFGAAMLFRVLLLAAVPALSEDYARFIWDGQLTVHGISPFRYLPAEVMAGVAGPSFRVDRELYALLNSPNYYTIYPPVNQAVFALTSGLALPSLLSKIMLMRGLIIGAEAGTIWLMVSLLTRMGRNPNLALLYALNPLVILELTGNIHFEGMMVGFVLLAIWLWLSRVGTQRLLLSAGAMALGVCTKLLPLMVLPLVITRLGWRLGLCYSGLVLGMVAVLFMPFFDVQMIRHLFESLDLYFRKFEFNASVYYLVRAVGYWLYGFNWLSAIGGWLSVLTTVGLLVIAFYRSDRTKPALLATRVLWMLTFYFVMATTVHPWYLTSLVAVAVFAATSEGRPFRYPLLWSALIWVSYAAYQYAPVRESPALLLLEYIPVIGLLTWELFQPQCIHRTRLQE